MQRESRFPRAASRSGRGWIVVVVLVAIAAVVAYFALRDRGSTHALVPEFERSEPASSALAEPLVAPDDARVMAAPDAPNAAKLVNPPLPTVVRSANATIRLLSGGTPMKSGRVVLDSFFEPRRASDVDAATGEARFTELRPASFRIALEAIPAGWVVARAMAKHRDQDRRGEEIRLELGENHLDLELEPGAVVHGIVHDEKGWPEENARVRISSLEPWDRAVPSRDVDVKGGEFLVHVHDGISLIEVFSTHPERQRVPPTAQPVVLAVGARADLVFRFEAGTESFSGRIVDEQGMPFAGLRVGVSRSQVLPTIPGARASSGPSRQGLRGSRTDADGRFAFEGLPRGTCVVHIEEKAVGPFDRPHEATVARIQHPRTVELPLAEPWTLVVERAHPVLVRGRVLGDRKGRVFSVDVVLAVSERRTEERRQDFSLDRDGRFEFHLEASETGAAIEVRNEGRVARVPLLLSPTATEISVDVPLP